MVSIPMSLLSEEFVMFWTAFIWGLGVSCGACFGLLLFIILKSGVDWLLNSTAGQRAQEVNKRTLDLLEGRNELTQGMVDHLAIIAEAARRTNSDAD